MFPYSYTDNLPENFGKNVKNVSAHEKSPLPVEVRRSKTLLLKLLYSGQNEHFMQKKQGYWYIHTL